MENSNDEQTPAAPGDAEQGATVPGGHVHGGDPVGPQAHTGGDDGPQPVEPPEGLHIRLDREDVNVPLARLHDGELTGREIRELATPPIGADRDLFEIVPGGSDRKIEDGDTVTIRDHLRFFSAPSNINPGTVAVRQLALSALRPSAHSPCGRTVRHASQ